MTRIDDLYVICPSCLSAISDKVGFGPDNLKKIINQKGHQPKNGQNLVDLAKYSSENGNKLLFFPSLVDHRELFEYLKCNIRYFTKENIACEHQFAIFLNKSSNPEKDGYLCQARVIPKSTLSDFFGPVTSSEYDCYYNQKYSLGDFLTDFYLSERLYWYNVPDYPDYKLGFGLMVEDEEKCIYRLFSRLIKK